MILFLSYLVENSIYRVSGICKLAMEWYVMRMCPTELCPFHSRPQRPRSFWSAPRIATSGLVQHRKSAIHGLPVTLRMLRVKSDKSDWFWSQSIVFSKPFKTRTSLDLARGRDSWCWPKGARPLGTGMCPFKVYYPSITYNKLASSMLWTRGFLHFALVTLRFTFIYANGFHPASS